MGSGMTPAVSTILRKIESLPPLPAAVHRLSTLTDDPNVDLNKVVKIISSDPALTSKILRVANSIFYSLSERVSTVAHAAVILGISGIRNLAIGVTVFGNGVREWKSPYMTQEDFWKHCLSVAIAARQLAPSFQISCLEEAFVAGLLVDIGKVVFMEFFPEAYAAILEKAVATSIPLSTLEREEFGMDHGAVGEALCKHWSLSSRLAYVVGRHHHPLTLEAMDSEDVRLAHVVRAAYVLSRVMQVGSCGDPRTEKDVFPLLDNPALSFNCLRRLVMTLPGELRKAEVFFDLAHGSRLDDPEDWRSARAVGVFLSDPQEREMVILKLLSMGYGIATREQIHQGDNHVAAALTDHAVDAEISSLLTEKKVKILDYEAWRESLGGEGLHIDQLTAWLRAGLPPPHAA